MKKIFQLITVLVVISFTLIAYAEDKPAEKASDKPEEKVKTGIIASTSTSPGSISIDVDTSGSSPGDDINVISASISRVKKNECVVKLTNGGEKTYSVSYAVEGVNKRGMKTLSKSFSASVAPKATKENSVSGCNEDLNLSVNLKSAKASGK